MSFPKYLDYIPKEGNEESKQFKIPAVTLDIPLILAEKQAIKVHGRGITVDSENPKIVDYLNEFIRVNRLHEQFIKMEEMCSMWGQTVSCLNPILPGEKMPRWGYADPYMMSRVDKMFVTETSATVYKYLVMDTKTWPVIETWTEKTVKRQYYQDVTKVDTG